MSNISATDAAALPYSEPSIEVILVQSSFLFVLNVLNWALDAVLYCGLIGQIFTGIAWGTPGGRLLSSEAENVAVQLGYIGLILLVFEGGLSTSFRELKANLALSAGIALTGIAAPIGLSFVLGPLAGATSLQCFAAGAALCSTSLGTTLTVLRASGLASTRLSVVLTSAAMMDDVVGLVMIQVIANLGGGDSGSEGSSISAVTIVRPILVSVALAVVVVALCRLVVKPVALLLNKRRALPSGTGLDNLLRRREVVLVLHSGLLLALVAGASYAGASNLFAAYIAGSVISWWDSEVPHAERAAGSSDAAPPRTPAASEATAEPAGESNVATQPPRSNSLSRACDIATSGTSIYEQYYQPAVKWVLQPLFFASIGFSVPITRMFTGNVIWRGVIYAILMAMGKLLCGIWLVKVPGGIKLWLKSLIKSFRLDEGQGTRPNSRPVERTTPLPAGIGAEAPGLSQDETPAADSDARESSLSQDTVSRGDETGSSEDEVATAPIEAQLDSRQARNATPNPRQPLSLYPSAIIGLAMVPRGEIGLLISSEAESNGVFGQGESVFLIVTWAVLLCTLAGPFCVGLLVRRVRRLESGKATPNQQTGGLPSTSPKDTALGVWGVME